MSRPSKVLKGRPFASEKDVLKGCLELLDLYPAIRAWRMNTGAVVTEYKGKQRFIRFGIPGMADITGILSLGLEHAHGLRLEIECKSVTGRQSETQKAFQTMIEIRGGIYLLVRSPGELQDELEKIGLKPGRGR